MDKWHSFPIVGTYLTPNEEFRCTARGSNYSKILKHNDIYVICSFVRIKHTYLISLVEIKDYHIVENNYHELSLSSLNIPIFDSYLDKFQKLSKSQVKILDIIYK